jgi:hypothetical protein
MISQKTIKLCEAAKKSLDQAITKAAIDTGDTQGDRARKRALGKILESIELLDTPDGQIHDEVAAAVTAARTLRELMDKLSEMSIRIKSARTGSIEAMEAQKEVDRIRGRVDQMLPPLEATLTSLVRLVEMVRKQEAKFAEHKSSLDLMNDQLMHDRTSLENAAKAVQHAIQIG